MKSAYRLELWTITVYIGQFGVREDTKRIEKYELRANLSL